VALTTNPKFCLGYRNLGTIYDETGQTEDACRQFGKFREYCPDAPEAHLREGTCLAKLGKVQEAKASFEACAQKAQDPMKGDCQRLKEQLGP
jgi:TolA-binding protein